MCSIHACCKHKSPTDAGIFLIHRYLRSLVLAGAEHLCEREQEHRAEEKTLEDGGDRKPEEEARDEHKQQRGRVREHDVVRPDAPQREFGS